MMEYGKLAQLTAHRQIVRRAAMEIGA